jgi:hypothetical protein
MGHSASMADYDRAWRKFHANEKLASPAGIKAASEHSPVRAATEKPTARQTPQERLAQAHDALDMVRRLGGFLFLACACGAQLKIPPSYSRPQLRCPRCGASHDVSEAKPSAS